MIFFDESLYKFIVRAKAFCTKAIHLWLNDRNVAKQCIMSSRKPYQNEIGKRFDVASEANFIVGCSMIDVRTNDFLTMEYIPLIYTGSGFRCFIAVIL